jgi:hypothetical protein
MDLLAFCEPAQVRSLDRRHVDDDDLGSVVGLDETVTHNRIKPYWLSMRFRFGLVEGGGLR